MKVLVILFFLLTLNPNSLHSSQPPYSHSANGNSTKENLAPSNSWIKSIIKEKALKYNVDPALAIAVAHIESRKGKKEFRIGRMGKTYFGPMGIHKCFLKKWAIDKPKINIEIGVRALRGIGYNKSKQKRRLKKYNASFNRSYWNSIQEATLKYKKEGW